MEVYKRCRRGSRWTLSGIIPTTQQSLLQSSFAIQYNRSFRRVGRNKECTHYHLIIADQNKQPPSNNHS